MNETIITDKSLAEEKQPLDDKLLELSCKVDEIGAIAFCAANSSITTEKCRMYLTGALHGIISLSEQIASELYDISFDLSEGKGDVQ